MKICVFNFFLPYEEERNHNKIFALDFFLNFWLGFCTVWKWTHFWRNSEQQQQYLFVFFTRWHSLYGILSINNKKWNEVTNEIFEKLFIWRRHELMFPSNLFFNLFSFFHLLIIIYELPKDRLPTVTVTTHNNSFFLTGKPPHLSGRHESMNILLAGFFFSTSHFNPWKMFHFYLFLISVAYFLQTVKKKKMNSFFFNFFLTIIIKELIIVFDNKNK